MPNEAGTGEGERQAAEVVFFIYFFYSKTIFFSPSCGLLTGNKSSFM